MQVARKVDLRHGGAGFNEAQNAVNLRQPRFAHLVRNQPPANDSPADGGIEHAQVMDREIGRNGEGLRGSAKQIVLGGEDSCVPQNGIGECRTNRSLDGRQQVVTETIARVRRVAIGRVFTKTNPVLIREGGQTRAPNLQQRPKQGQPSAAIFEDRRKAHSSEASRSAPSQEVVENRFDLIIGVVRQYHSRASMMLRGREKERVPQFTRGELERNSSVQGVSPRVGTADEHGQTEQRSVTSDKRGVCGRCAPSQSVIQVRNNQTVPPELRESVQEGHRVPAAGNANDQPPAGQSGECRLNPVIHHGPLPLER